VTVTLSADRVEDAVAILAVGGLVAIPTETVYGLAARADSPRAVHAVFAAKARPTDHPLIVHVADIATARRWALMTPVAEALAAAFWPGPLTLLLRRSDLVCDAITGGRDTVAVRMPDHELALAVIEGLGHPVVAPSANRFGRVSPTTAEHVLADLEGRIDAVLDGGPCAVGVESTIVDCTGEHPRILRPGILTADDIAAASGRRVSDADLGATGTGSSEPMRAPGMLAAHYAPACRLVCVGSSAAAGDLERTERAAGRAVRILDPGTDIAGFARRLYSDLHRADKDGIEVLIAVLPPDAGIGVAVRDRLMKAAEGSGVKDR
jgi:L-threonylcarbamoyladenylate synthase